MKKTHVLLGTAVLFATTLFVLLANSATPYPPWLFKITGAVTFNEKGSGTLASSITASGLAANAVETAKINDLAVTAGKLAAEAVTEAKLEDDDGSGLYARRIARFVYDTEAGAPGEIGAHTLGVTLPANAVITRSYFKIITQFSDAGSGTVALSCEDADNIKTATDITGSSANAFVEGASTGAASAFVRGIASACVITATVAGSNQDTGKLVGWVEYVIEE